MIAGVVLRVAVIGFLWPIILSSSLVLAAEPKAAWQADWDKTLKAAEEERELVIYMTQAFEPVFREAFQKKYPKIKVTMVTGRGPELSQRVMNERRADKFMVDLYVSGNISPLTVFHRAKILEPVKPLLVLPEVVDTIRLVRRQTSLRRSRKPLHLRLRGNAAEAGRLLTTPSS